MGDYGMKIAKQGKNINSINIDDYVFWSKHPSLTLLEVKTEIITTTSAVCSGTKVVPHTYDFIPMVEGWVKKTSGNPIDDIGNRYIAPATNFAGLGCDRFGMFDALSFGLNTKKDKVEIVYGAECVMQGYAECPMFNQTFQVDLFFYMWELGSSWPI